MLSGRSLCDGPITHSGESYRPWCGKMCPRNISQNPQGKRRSEFSSWLRLWVRIPPEAWMSLANIVCCQVEVSATGWSLIQGCPIERGVSEYECEVSKMVRPRPTRDCCTTEDSANIIRSCSVSIVKPQIIGRLKIWSTFQITCNLLWFPCLFSLGVFSSKHHSKVSHVYVTQTFSFRLYW